MGLIDIGKSVVKKATRAAGDVVDKGKSAAGAVTRVAEKGVDATKSTVQGAAHAAGNLYDKGKSGLTTVARVADKAVDKASDVGAKVVEKAADKGGSFLDKVGDFGKGVVNGVSDFGKGVVDKAEDLGEKAVEVGKGGLGALDTLTNHVVSDTYTHLRYGKEDGEVAERVKDATRGDHPQDMSELIDDVKGIHDDQTRIRSISRMYGVQSQQMADKIGIHDMSSWSGWANQAAGLVADIHGGQKGLTSYLGNLTGANDDLAYGNKKVFADIAPVTNSFVNNVDKFATDGKFDSEKFDAWWGKQKLGEESVHDENFKQGFYNYAQAKYADSDEEKRAWYAAGTIRMAQHEQRLLQPEIENAMRGGVVGKAVNLAGDVAEAIPGHQFVPALAGVELGRDGYNAGTGFVGTKSIPEVGTGKGSIDVDSTVPLGNPAVLTQATGAARNELIDAMRDSGIQPGQTEVAGASDYSDYDQRIKVLTAIMLSNANTVLPTRQ